MTYMSYFRQVLSLTVNCLKFSLIFFCFFLAYNTQHITLYTLDKMNNHNDNLLTWLFPTVKPDTNTHSDHGHYFLN